MKQILVTGGAGAIGSNLVRRLLDEGAAVTVLDDLSSGVSSNVDQRARFVQADVADPAALAEVLRTSFHEIYHLAAFFANQNSCDHPLDDFRVNATGTVQLFEAVRNQSELQTLLLASTSSVAGELSTGLEHGFSTPYMTSKYVGELYARYYVHSVGLPIRVVRYFNCYGPGEYPGRYRNVIINFIERAMRGEPLTITGDGSETRDYTFVEDIVSGTIAVARSKDTIGPTFDIGTGRETTILEIAERINALTGNAAGLQFQPRRNWDKTLRRRAAVEQARVAAGFEAATALEEGLRRTVEWYGRTRPA